MESDLIGRKNQWVPISKQELSFSIKKNKQLRIEQKRFLLVLAWAWRTYKAKGLSLHCGAISFSLQGQKSFNQGQRYVSLSRIRSLENI